MSIIAFANQKGGVTKTTSTHNIAAVMAESGKKVCMLDLDPQASLTRSCGYDPLDFDLTVYDLFKDKKISVDKAIYSIDEVSGLNLIPSTTRLAKMELELISQMSREYRLKRILEPIQTVFDYILIDCPPQLSLLTLNAFAASEYIVIPCETARLSYYALKELGETIEGVQEELNSNLKVLGLIATLYSSQANADNEVLKALEEHEYPLLGICKRTVAAKKGLSQGLPVVINEPKSQLSQSYQKVTENIINRIEGESK